MRPLVKIVLASALAGGAMHAQNENFDQLLDRFVYGSLALAPVDATAAGLHAHDGKQLDNLLDDYSVAGIRQRIQFYSGMKLALDRIAPQSLQPEQRADYRLMRDQVELMLLRFGTTRDHEHNPTVYVELVGNALFTPFVLDYAPKPQRFQSIIERLDRVPTLMQQAKQNLRDAPEVWNRVAQEENDGNLRLIDDTLRRNVPPELKSEYDKAAGGALASLRDFNAFLSGDLSKKTSDWRLGKKVYDVKFKWTLDIGKTPAQVLNEAETALKSVQAEMRKLARTQSIPEALNAIAQRHATPAAYMNEAKRDLEEATDFIKAKNLVPLPGPARLDVIETPEFMRGIYGVGGFNPAPALEPQLGAFYWVTPIPPGWPRERVESKLREYNEYGMQELTIHEAMPGHFVQFEYANRVQPQTRRVLRNLYGNGPYVEGWATYTQQLMSDEGYLNNSVPLRMTFLKQMLRVITNAILDIRLQTMHMTDDEAMDLMLTQAYQEKEEAAAKLQRAKLSSCQLPMYFVGWRGWLDVREAYAKQLGPKFNLSEFHKRALEESAVPLPVLNELLQY